VPSIAANISLGRIVELYDRVNSNDPTNSALIMLVLATGGDPLETLRDYDTVSAVLAGPSNEVTNGSYARKTLTDADLAAWTPDDVNNRVLLTLPVQTFATIAAGNSWDIVVVAYDNDTTSGTDANLIPIGFHELRFQGSPIVPDGNNIVVDFSAGWAQAT
jgi:hypothetical protein